MVRSRLALGWLFSLAVLAACGGRVTHDPGDRGSSSALGGAGGGDGPGGEAGSTDAGGFGGEERGGAPSGGTDTDPGGTGAGGAPTGGASSPGGESSTGASAPGGRAGAGATGGAGGALGECTAPSMPGPCSALVLEYRHDPALGLCVPFQFDACDASPNRYATRDACVAACRGGEPDLDACSSATDCVVTSIGCCGPCDPVDTAWLVAVSADRIPEFNELVGCGDVLCEQCLPVAPNDRTSRYAYAACVGGQCVVRDLRERAVTECQTAADCRLRCGTDCCEGCTAGVGVVAVRADAAVDEELCDGPSACDDCACDIPPEYSAACVDGHCVAPLDPVCEPGADQTCNANPILSSLHGTCTPEGTCTCNDPFAIELATGRCL